MRCLGALFLNILGVSEDFLPTLFPLPWVPRVCTINAFILSLIHCRVAQLGLCE